MARPLYREAAKEPQNLTNEGHAGLWFDKFCNTWSVGNREWSLSSADTRSESPKLRWINSVTISRMGSEGQLMEVAQRLSKMAVRRGGKVAVFTSDSRFVTGLGQSHPVENGFAWHPILGVPFLPGSSIKGMVRSWAELDADPRPDTMTRQRILGDVDHVGNVVFLDAIPFRPVQLEADVITPHYAGWTAEDPPGDWRSPTPIPFLVAAAETSFLFTLIPRDSGNENDLDTVLEWLASALKWAGSGAKTAVGYGRAREDEAATRLFDKVAVAVHEETPIDHQAPAPPETAGDYWRQEVAGLSEEDVLELVRINLERGDLEDGDARYAFASAVVNEHANMVSAWRRRQRIDPANTSAGGRKCRDRAQLLDSIVAERAETI